MKKYDNFNYSFFLTVICIIATLALVFTVAVVTIGVFFSDGASDSDTDEPLTLPDAMQTQDTESDTEPNTSESQDTQSPDTIPPETDVSDTTPVDTEPTETQPADTEADVPTEPTPTILAESEDMGQEYLDKIVFLVDATNVGLRSYGVLSGGKNTTQVWRTTSGTLTLSGVCEKEIIYPETSAEMTIAQAAAKKKPEYLVITLGFEGMNQIGEETFIKEYTALIEAVKAASPDTKIMLQSIYPIASRVTGKVSNTKIDQLNSTVLSIAQSCDVKYLDTCSVLKDSDGALKEEYDNGGTGWNMDAQGFGVVLSYIKTHGYK